MLFFHDSNKAGLVFLILSWNGVSIVPGDTALHLILSTAKSLANALVSKTIAPLAVP